MKMPKRLIFIFILTVGLSVHAQTDGPATLPSGYTTTYGIFDTTFPDTTGYTVKTVCASGCDYTSVATAYSSVSCKTVLRVRANESFQGNVNANKACTSGNWIITMSDDCTSADVCTHILGQGNRIAVNEAAVDPTILAKITGANTNNADTVTIASGAAYNWFGPGLYITGPADGTSYNQGGIIFDQDTTSNHITFDRDYVTCAAGQDCTRMWAMKSPYDAFVDGIATGAHSLVSQQSQALWEAEGLGPQKIVNNYLGGASEVYMTGGSGCPPTDQLAANIEVAGNYLVYDFGNRTSTWLSSYSGSIRDIIENKEGYQLLLQGNVLDASLIQGTNSNALNYGFLPRTAQTCSWIKTHDVTFRFNHLLYPVGPFAIQGVGADAADSFYNLSIHDNLAEGLNRTNGQGSNEDGYAINSYNPGDTANIFINHNTVVSTDNGHTMFYTICEGGALFSGSFIFTNNIGFAGSYDIAAIAGSGFVTGITGVNGCFSSPSDYTITGNLSVLVVGSGSDTWSAGNFHAANAAAVGFTNFNSGVGGDYSLTSGSTYHNAATDGKDIGVSDFSCLNSLASMATNGTYTESAATCAGGSSPSTPAAPSKLGILLLAGNYVMRSSGN